MHYRIAEPTDEHAAAVLRSVIDWLRQDREMQRDRERIVRICCAPKLPVQLQGAPIPQQLVTLDPSVTR
jgi:hypothetical protein